MDTTKPPLMCPERGKPVWPNEPWEVRWAERTDDDGEPTGQLASPMMALHPKCARAFDAEHT